MSNITQKQIDALTDLYNDTQESYDYLMDCSIKEKNPVKRERITKARYGRFCQISMLEKVCNALGLETNLDIETQKFVIKEKEGKNGNKN